MYIGHIVSMLRGSGYLWVNRPFSAVCSCLDAVVKNCMSARKASFYTFGLMIKTPPNVQPTRVALHVSTYKSDVKIAFQGCTQLHVRVGAGSTPGLHSYIDLLRP